MKYRNSLLNSLILIYRKLLNQNIIKYNLKFKCTFSHNNETKLIYLAFKTVKWEFKTILETLLISLIFIYRKLINQNMIKYNLKFKCTFSHNNETRLIYLAFKTIKWEFKTLLRA